MKTKLLLMLTLLLTVVGGVKAEEVSWSGDGSGSANDPYIISDRNAFDLFAQLVNSGATDGTGSYASRCYKLEGNIDYDGIVGYTPIGTSDNPFTGTFDGNGHVVDGLQVLTKDENDNTIRDFEKEYVGLFGYVGNGGVVKNVKVTDPYMLGGKYTGGIVGYNLGTIDNCRIDNQRGVLYGESEIQSTTVRECYGCIAGYNSGTIQNCVSASTVQSYINTEWERHKVGGIVGHNTGTVQNCLYLGYNLLGENLAERVTSYVGAIVGYNDNGTLTGNLYCNNQYRSDGLNRYDNIGVLIKGVGADNVAIGIDVEGAKEAKRVFFSGYYVRPDNLSVYGSYTETGSNPDNQPLRVYSNGLLFNDVDLVAYSLKKGKIFYTAASNITLTCDLSEEGYEVVYAIDDYEEGTSLNGATLTLGTGDVTVTANMRRVPTASSWLAEGNRATSFSSKDDNAKTITISSAAELGLLAYNVNFGGETYEGYTITLSNAIILDQTNDRTGLTWEPIGYGVGGGGMGVSPIIGGEASGFLGTFDGAAMPIINMNVTGESYVGLFSVVQSGAIVKNVILQAPQVQGEMYVGAIAGICSGTILNCHVSSGRLEFNTTDGGDDEYPYYGPSAGVLGGIAGWCSGGSILGCTVTETNIYSVADAQVIGGIVGGVFPQTIYDSETYEESEFPAVLKDCLFTGSITEGDDNVYVGAIAGMSQGTNTITNNYYIDGTNPHATSNTTLKGINGADTDGALSATKLDQNMLPTNIGTEGTQYAYNGVLPYQYGIYYNLYYYLSANAPEPMDITLSNTENNSELLSTYEGRKGTVTLGGRKFYKDGDWNTICLPFTIDIEGSPLDGDGVELWQLSEGTGFDESTGTLTLNFENWLEEGAEGKPTIIAGQPYLIKWAKPADYEGKENEYDLTEDNLVFDDVTIEVTEPIGDNAYSEFITFVGTFSGTTFDTENRSILMLGGNNTLYYPAQGAFIGACRAYFQLNGITAGDPRSNEQSVKAFVLNFGDNLTTGIKSMDKGAVTTDSEAGAWYDLSGRKVQKNQNGQLPRGIYVNNGRKVVIK